MNRLTEQIGWYDDAHEFKVFAPKGYGTPDEVDDVAITNRLGEFEEVVFTTDGTPRISLDELCELVQAKQDGRAKKQCIHSGFCDMPCSGYDDSCISYRAAAEAAKGEQE